MSSTRTKLVMAARKLVKEGKELKETIEKEERKTKKLTRTARRLIKQIIG